MLERSARIRTVLNWSKVNRYGTSLHVLLKMPRDSTGFLVFGGSLLAIFHFTVVRPLTIGLEQEVTYISLLLTRR